MCIGHTKRRIALLCDSLKWRSTGTRSSRLSAVSPPEDDASLVLPLAIAEEAWPPCRAQLEASLELLQRAEAGQGAAAVDVSGVVPVCVPASIRGSGGGIRSIMKLLLEAHCTTVRVEMSTWIMQWHAS